MLSARRKWGMAASTAQREGMFPQNTNQLEWIPKAQQFQETAKI
jgi:hypothetical protein